MNEFREVVKRSGIKSPLRLCRLVDEFSTAGIASLPIMLDALKYPDDDVRGTAARALGRIEDGRLEVIDALVIAMSDEAVIVRQSAAAALGVVGKLPSNAVVVLCQALDDEDRHVREFSAMALDQHVQSQQLIAKAG